MDKTVPCTSSRHTAPQLARILTRQRRSLEGRCYTLGSQSPAVQSRLTPFPSNSLYVDSPSSVSDSAIVRTKSHRRRCRDFGRSSSTWKRKQRCSGLSAVWLELSEVTSFDRNAKWAQDFAEKMLKRNVLMTLNQSKSVLVSSWVFRRLWSWCVRTHDITHQLKPTRRSHVMWNARIFLVHLRSLM